MREISIITVVVSEADVIYYKSCLDSIYASASNVDFDLWVVDNTRREGSLDDLIDKRPELNVIEVNEIAGFGANNNKAILATDSKYLCFLNPDTIVEEGILDKFHDFMERTPEAAVAGCEHVSADLIPFGSSNSFPDLITVTLQLFGLKRLVPPAVVRLLASWRWTTIFGKSIRSHFDNFFETGLEAREVDWVGGAALFVRRSYVDIAGVFDEEFFLYYEDVDWCFRIKKSGGKIYHLPDIRLIHDTGDKRSRQGSKMIAAEKTKSMLRYFRKHKGSLYAGTVRLIALVAALTKLVVSIIVYPFRRRGFSPGENVAVLRILLGGG